MAKTAAERQKECRRRKKEAGLHDDMKKKDRERKAKMKASMTAAAFKRHRVMNALLQRLSRQNKKQISQACNNSSPLSPYKSRQSLGKAVKKVSRSLPKSPRKVKKVIQCLSDKYCASSSKEPEKNNDKQPSEISVLVEQFYCQDDISWMAPGLKDSVLIRSPTGKFRVQKRYMLMTLKEAHQLFKEFHTDVKCGLSLFCSLRPIFVKCLSAVPHNTCTCKYHENVRMLLKALARAVNSVPTEFRLFLNKIVCSQESESCMLSQCESCADYFHNYSMSFVERETFISWEQWSTDESNRCIVNTTEGTVQECFDLLKCQLPYFKKHTFIKREQSKAFKLARENNDSFAVTLQVDFAENFTIIKQNEIQSAHWSHNQVTIFTACAWLNGETQSFAIISDELSHDKYTVESCLQLLFNEVKSLHPQIKEIIIFSDGPSSQFKQKHTFTAVTFLREEFSLEKLEWNFFASGHGKGAVDGIGGQLKSQCRRLLLAETAPNIQTAEGFYDFIKSKQQTTKVLYLSSKSIKERARENEARWSLVTEAIPGTRDIHHLSVLDKYLVKIKVFSNSNEFKIYDLEKGNFIEKEIVSCNKDYVVGSFCLATYYGKKSKRQYLAQITVAESDSEIEVLNLRKRDGKGLVFAFPEKEDRCIVDKKDLTPLCIQPTFQIVGNRTRYVFEKAVPCE